jgi:hypothetical protein
MPSLMTNCFVVSVSFQFNITRSEGGYREDPRRLSAKEIRLWATERAKSRGSLSLPDRNLCEIFRQQDAKNMTSFGENGVEVKKLRPSPIFNVQLILDKER